MDDILARTQINLCSERVPTDIDTDNPVLELLPPPMAPMVCISNVQLQIIVHRLWELWIPTNLDFLV